MNRQQLAYQVGRAVYNNYDIMFLAMAIKFGHDSVYSFLNSQGFSDFGNIALGIFSGVPALYVGFNASQAGAVRGLLYLELKNITRNRESYPLEHSDRVIIDDVGGLDVLLSKTHYGESREWGTLLKAHDDKGRAVIYEVLDIHLGKELGLIGEGTRSSMVLKTIRANEEGYKGSHHYHPDVGPRWFGARNFSVSLIDRFQPEDWINLLTFNLPEGPEIVGFNRQHIYIPTDNSKRELVRATPRQIMEYLRA